MVNGQAGKGSRYRPVDPKKWDENWEKTFGKNNTKKKDPNNERKNSKNDKR